MRKLLFLLVFPIAISATAGGNKSSMEDLTLDLMEALDTRNFQHAKEVLNEMIPLMKKDIKESKKLISRAEKGEVDAIDDLDSFKQETLKKEEILAYTERLMNTSSAALRARSDELAEKIDEYVQ